MCAPAVIDAVRGEMSRRQVLGLLGGTALATSLTREAHARQEPVMLSGEFTEVFDLTHTMSPETPVFPILQPMQIVSAFTIGNPYPFNAYDLTLSEHTGTHMDAPVHFTNDGETIDQIAPSRLIAPLAVVSVESRAASDHDTLLTVDDIRAWERQHGRLPAGAFVAMLSGWDSRVGDSGQFLNADAEGVHHWPGFSVEAARFLTEERDIVGAGVDTLSLDTGTSADFAAHQTLLPAGKYGLELMANLASVPPAGATLIVGAMKHLGGTGGPVRALAVA